MLVFIKACRSKTTKSESLKFFSMLACTQLSYKNDSIEVDLNCVLLPVLHTSGQHETGLYSYVDIDYKKSNAYTNIYYSGQCLYYACSSLLEKHFSDTSADQRNCMQCCNLLTMLVFYLLRLLAKKCRFAVLGLICASVV